VITAPTYAIETIHIQHPCQNTAAGLVLAVVVGTRWRIKTVREEAKGEAGRDENEMCCGCLCHRPISLAMTFHAWLAVMRQLAGEKSAGLRACRSNRARDAPPSSDSCDFARTLLHTAVILVMLKASQAAASVPQSLLR